MFSLCLSDSVVKVFVHHLHNPPQNSLFTFHFSLHLSQHFHSFFMGSSQHGILQLPTNKHTFKDAHVKSQSHHPTVQPL